MINLADVLLQLAKPLVNDPNSINVKEMSSLNENEIVLYVYAKSDDIARLIGKKGVMANALRDMMSISGRVVDKKINIQFETY
ncbi:MAG: KH domain-containing protein [Erysipelotrichaceae bacterium]